MFKYTAVCEICDDGITSQIDTTRFSQTVFHRVEARRITSQSVLCHGVEARRITSQSVLCHGVEARRITSQCCVTGWMRDVLLPKQDLLLLNHVIPQNGCVSFDWLIS